MMATRTLSFWRVAPFAGAVGSGHGCVLSAAAPEGNGPTAVRFEGDAELIRERGENHIVRVRAEALCLGLDRCLELLRHAQEHNRARARQRAPAVRRDVADAEGCGENADRDVVQAGTPAGGLANESSLEGGRRPDEDTLPLRSASSHCASSIAVGEGRMPLPPVCCASRYRVRRWRDRAAAGARTGCVGSP